MQELDPAHSDSKLLKNTQPRLPILSEVGASAVENVWVGNQFQIRYEAGCGIGQNCVTKVTSCLAINDDGEASFFNQVIFQTKLHKGTPNYWREAVRQFSSHFSAKPASAAEVSN